MSFETLTKSLQRLRLPAIRENYEEYARHAIAESLSYEQYLHLLIEKEIEQREQNRVYRYLKESKLPPEKNLDSFDMKCLPTKAKHQIAQLLEGHFVDHKENVLIFGTPGAGKTHILCAIGLHLVQAQGKRVFFATCTEMVEKLLSAKKDLTLAKQIKKLSKYDVVIIDDIGYVEQSRSEMSVLFTLIAERYETGSVLISSNLAFSNWDQIFKDAMTTAAAIDRLVHHSTILDLNDVDSYRRQKAAKNL